MTRKTINIIKICSLIATIVGTISGSWIASKENELILNDLVDSRLLNK